MKGRQQKKWKPTDRRPKFQLTLRSVDLECSPPSFLAFTHAGECLGRCYNFPGSNANANVNVKRADSQLVTKWQLNDVFRTTFRYPYENAFSLFSTRLGVCARVPARRCSCKFYVIADQNTCYWVSHSSLDLLAAARFQTKTILTLKACPLRNWFENLIQHNSQAAQINKFALLMIKIPWSDSLDLWLKLDERKVKLCNLFSFSRGRKFSALVGLENVSETEMSFSLSNVESTLDVRLHFPLIDFARLIALIRVGCRWTIGLTQQLFAV